MEENTAGQLTELADEILEAVTPGYTREELERIAADLEGFARVDPRVAFGHTLREHRKAFTSFDDAIRAVTLLASRVMRDATADADQSRRVQTALKAGCRALRVCRALAATLAGDSRVLQHESDDVRSDVEALLKERGAAVAATIPKEELDALHTDHGSEQLEAWLAIP